MRVPSLNLPTLTSQGMDGANYGANYGADNGDDYGDDYYVY